MAELFVAGVVVAILVLCARPAEATTLTWSGAAGGIWSTSATNWSLGPATPWDNVNGPTDVAFFGSGSPTPTINGGVFANGVTFASPTTVSGGTLNLAGTSPAIITNAASTINGTLAGSGGLTLSGNSTLTLASINAYTGPTTITAGTLRMGPLASFPTGIVAHYPFDGNTNDTSGNGLNATLQSGPTSYAAGQFGQAISLQSAFNQYLTVPYNSTLNLTGAYTVSIWLNPADANGNSVGIISTRNGGDNTFDLQYQASSGVIHGDIGNGSGWLTTSADYASQIAVGTWNMITYSVSPTGYAIYVNGAQKATGSYSGTPEFMTGSETLSLGSQESGYPYYGSSGFFNGALDEACIFNAALTPAQVGSLYIGQAATLPGATAVSVSSGATWDLNGTGQAVSGLTGAGNITLGSGGRLTVATAGTSTFAGVISDSGSGGSLAVAGSGWLGLTMANTFSGNTTVSGGTLDLLNASAIQNSTLVPNGGTVIFDHSVVAGAFTSGGLSGSGNLALQDSAANPVTLTVGGNGANTTFLGSLSGPGVLAKTGTGTLTLGGSDTYSGGTSINGGVLCLASATAPPGNVTFDGGTLQFAVNSTNGLFNAIANSKGPIAIDTNGETVFLYGGIDNSNSAGLTKVGAGVLGIASSSSYRGPTTISGGTLQLGGPSQPIQNGNFANPAILSNSFIYYSNMSSSQQAALVWTCSGNVALMNNSTEWGYNTPYPIGNQAFSLQGNAWFGEPLSLGPGTYQVSWRQQGRPSQGAYAANPFYFQVNGVNQGTLYTPVVGTWTFASDTFTISTSGLYTISFLGTGASDNDADALNDVVLNSGQTTGALPSQTAVNVAASSAALNLNGMTQAIGSLTGVAGSSVIDNGALISGNDGTNTTFAGVISGTGSLTKVGSGTSTLSGANTYSGSTSVAQGELLVNGSLVSPVTVDSGGVLSGMGSLTTATIDSGGTLSPGDAPGALNLSGSLSLLHGAVMDYELGTPSDSDEVLMPGGLLALNNQQFSDFDFTPLPGFGPGEYDLIDFGSSSGSLGAIRSGTLGGLPASIAIQADELVLTVVPEPGTLALVLVATAVVWCWRQWSTPSQLCDYCQLPTSQPYAIIRARMKTRTYFVSSCLGLFALASIGVSSVVKANTIYTIEDYPALENGYTLWGTITTDGVTGVLSATDIVDWNVNISQGNALLTNAVPSTGFIEDCNNLHADTTGLWLSTVSGENRFNVVDGIPGDDFVVLQYNFVHPFPGQYLGGWPGHGELWNDLSNNGFSPPADFIIAAPEVVPEPASIAIFAASALALFAIGWRRHRLRLAAIIAAIALLPAGLANSDAFHMPSGQTSRRFVTVSDPGSGAYFFSAFSGGSLNFSGCSLITRRSQASG
jgi:autotransporter-associated beta strand protein